MPPSQTIVTLPHMNRYTHTFLLFCSLTLFLFTANEVQAGDKLSMIYRNTGKVKQGTLLIAPVLPDPFVVEKLSKPGKEAKLALYKEQVTSANKFLKEALEEVYDFCPMIFLDTVPEMQQHDTYFTHLATYDESTYYVLQFGNVLQWITDPPNKIRKYDRDVLGIYRTDGKTKMLLFPGSVKHCWKPEYAFGRILAMQTMLEKYYLKGRKKGLIRKKS